MSKPEKRFQVGPCSASVFANEVQGEKGKVVQRHIVLQRAYKDKDGKFQNTSSFGVNDVPKAIVALQKAYEHVVLERAAAVARETLPGFVQ